MEDGAQVMAHLLLYYRHLSKVILDPERANKDRLSNLKQERKLFRQLESAFDQIFTNRSDQICKLVPSITPTSEDAFLLESSTSIFNQNDIKHKLVSLHEIEARVKRLVALTKDTAVNDLTESSAKSIENGREGKQIKKELRSRSVEEMKQIILKKNAEETNTMRQQARPRARVSPEQGKKRKKVSVEFVYSDNSVDGDTEAEHSNQSDPEFEQPSTESEEEEKAWAQRSNRPRRACTIHSPTTPNKGSEPITSNKKIKTVVFVDRVKPVLKKKTEVQTKSDSSEAVKPNENKTQSNRTVEELVVNCDPFSLFNQDDSADHYLKGSGSVKLGPAPTPVGGLTLIGNKVCLPINNQNNKPILMTGEGKQSSLCQFKPILPAPMAGAGKQSSASVSVLNSSSPTTGSVPLANVPSAKLVGKSLGKVLMINSVPFLIRNGDKLHIPMLTDESSANQLVKNLTTMRTKNAPTSVTPSQPNASLLATDKGESAPTQSALAIQSTSCILEKTKIKAEIETDDDCTEIYAKQVNKKKRTPVRNRSPLVYSSSSGKSLSAPAQLAMLNGGNGKLVLLSPPQPSNAPTRSAILAQIGAQTTISTARDTSSADSASNPTQRKISLVNGNSLVSPKSNSSTVAICGSLTGKTTPNILSKALSASMRQRLNQLRMKNSAMANALVKGSELTSPTSSSTASSQATSSKITSRTLISEAEIIALARRKSMARRIVPPLILDKDKAINSVESTASEDTSAGAVKVTSSAVDITQSRYKQAKAELFAKLKKGRYIPMIDPNNKNILLFRNDLNNTIMGFKCNFKDCYGFVTPRKDKLLQHLRCRHTNVKSYSCPDCPKTFALSNYLAMHRRVVHSTERPYRCTNPGCWKEFKLRKSLKGHMALHFYEKPFVCKHPGCAERFIYSYELKDHQVVHQYVFGSGPAVMPNERSVN